MNNNIRIPNIIQLLLKNLKFCMNIKNKRYLCKKAKNEGICGEMCDYCAWNTEKCG